MHVIYALEPLPATVTRSLFLAGPTPRVGKDGRPTAPSWRPAALAYLAARGYDGVVIVPEDRAGEWLHNYDHQVDWECEMRRAADIILFWVPRELQDMPAFTTNIEFGEDYDSGRTLYGRPPGTPKCGYLDKRYRDMTGADPHETLESLLDEALLLIPAGEARREGARHVPLQVWQHQAFRGWYENLTAAGNRLDGFEACGIIPAGKPHPARAPFAFLGRAKVWISAEERHESSEIIVGRPDVASVVLVHGTCRADATIVLTQHFRNAVSNHLGTVIEVPSGSSSKTFDPRAIALEEVREEAGIDIEDPERLVVLGKRQAAATILTHHLHAYALLLSDAEFADLSDKEARGEILGATPCERITLKCVRAHQLDEIPLDWTNLAIIEVALAKLFAPAERLDATPQVRLDSSADSAA